MVEHREEAQRGIALFMLVWSVILILTLVQELAVMPLEQVLDLYLLHSRFGIVNLCFYIAMFALLKFSFFCEYGKRVSVRDTLHYLFTFRYIRGLPPRSIKSADRDNSGG